MNIRFLLLMSVTFMVLVGLPTAPLMTQSSTLVQYVPGSSQKICQFTGEFDRERQQPTLNRTESRFGVVGTDLGSSFEHGGKIYFLFGDTWGRRRNEGNRDDSIAYSEDTHPEDCLTLQFVMGANGLYLSPQVPGISLRAFEVPTGGFSYNEAMYVFFTTDHSEQRVMGRSILARSTDNAQSFEYLYDVSRDKFINIAPVIINNSDIPGLPMSEGQGLLLWASSTYRESDPYLAYIPLSTVEDRETMRYFSGFDASSGQPRWSTHESEAVPLFSHPCIGELSVAWNPYLRKWLMLYNCANPRGINFRVTDQPWGPWSEAQVLFHPWEDNGYCHFMHVSWDYRNCDSVHDPGREREWGGEYGPYMIPRFTQGDATHTTIYYVMSTWNPYNVVLMKSVLEARTQSQIGLVYLTETAASLTADTLQKVYFQIALNINYSQEPAEQRQIIQTIRRHLNLLDKYGIKANYYFTGLAAEMIQRLDPALIQLLTEKSEARSLTLGHHGANRPPHPMPIERVKGQNWEEDVQAILDYESCALDPVMGQLDCSRPGGLKNMTENIFKQPIFSTGRFFQASILYVTKQFGGKMAVGLQDNTGAPRGDAWFLGILNRPDSLAIGPEMIVRWAQGGASPLSGLEQRIAALDKTRIRLISLLIHDTDFFRGRTPAQAEQIWQKYEEFIKWALARDYQVVALEDLYDLVIDDRERTITKQQLQKIAEFYVKQVDGRGERPFAPTTYPPDYMDLGNDYFSLADAWQALIQALAHYQQAGSLPDQLMTRDILGPTVLVKLETTPRTISPEDILKSAATALAEPLDRVPSSVRLEQAGIEVNASEHLYLMAKEYLSLLSDGPLPVELFKISMISRNVEAIAPDPNDPRNGQADSLTKQQFWTFKPARWK